MRGLLGLEGGRDALLVLFFALPPFTLQLAGPPPRLDADAVEYYSHLRSLYYDHDLEFSNEFAHFGILTRGDKLVPTDTGHRRSIFSVGPALLWMPFYAAGDLVARATGGAEDGYSATHIRAVCLASLVYGLAGLTLVHRIARELVGRSLAFWTTFLLLYATFLYWYVVFEPVMSHAGSFFLSALALAVWWDGRSGLTLRRAAALGLILGLAAAVRWQNGVLLLLPAATLLPRLRAETLATFARGAAALGGFALGALPQMLAWKAIFGEYLLADPPHGRDFLRLTHPYLLETFFSSRHGLLYWTPVLWGGFLGYLGLIRRDARTTLALLLPLAVMSYVNVCSGDWWAGGSFSNRRFDSCLPLLALGLARALAFLRDVVARRPGAALAAGGLVLTVWNLLFMEQYRQNRIPRDDTVSFARVAENNADLLAEWVGTPLAWPANWLFAAGYDLPAAKYDRMVGQYLFYRQNNLGGVIDLGDDRVDPALLAEGWTARTPCEDEICRGIEGRARVFAPLDVPETLELAVRAAGSGTLTVEVNGARVAESPLAPALDLTRVHVPASFWRRELNEIALTASPGSVVERLVFTRVERAR
jgi:hypothetical protein